MQKKTKYVLYGTSKKLKHVRNMNLLLNNEYLQHTFYYKYLGVFLDSVLNFNKHIDYVNKITSHKIFLLSKIRKCIDQHSALYIYKSMISPFFYFGDIVYEGGNKNRLDKLKRTQNRGLRICLNKHVDSDNLHRVAGIAELHVRRCSNIKKYMFLQKHNVNIVKKTVIHTRAYDAVIYKTCIPKIEKYKKGCCIEV